MTDWETPRIRRLPRGVAAVCVAALVIGVASVVAIRTEGANPVPLEIDPQPSAPAEPSPGAPSPDGISGDAMGGPVGSWRAIPPAPGNVARAEHVAFWAGSRLLVWGGTGPDGPRADGGLLDPSNGIWEALPPAPFPWEPGTGAVFAVPRRELVVVDRDASRVAVLHLATQTWREVERPPIFGVWAPFAAAWDGAGVVMTGIARRAEPSAPEGAGRAVRLDLDTGAWEALPDPPVAVWDDTGGAVAVATLVAVIGLAGRDRMGFTAWNPESGRWAPVHRLPGDGWWAPALTARGGQAFALGPAFAVGPVLGPEATGHMALRWGPGNGLVELPPAPLGPAAPGPAAPPLLGVAGQKLVVWAGDTAHNGMVLDLETDRWHDMAPGRTMSGRGTSASMTWNGYEFLFWGGRRDGRFFADGAAYLAPDPPDPPVERFEDVPERPGIWRLARPSPLQSTASMAVWTGHEVLVWGGSGRGDERAAAYDPATNTWRSLDPGPLFARRDALVAWTGEELLIWGGITPSGTLSDGAALHLSTRRWRKLPPPPQPSQPSGGVRLAAWDGSRWYLLRGGMALDLVSYDPGSDTWRSEPSPPGIVGAGMGLVATGEGRLLLHTNALHGNLWAYDADERAWEQLADQPEATPDGAVVAWTGEELLVWGGAADQPRPGGYAYAPATGHWRPIPPAPITPSGRSPTATWTGGELYVWGSRVIDGSYRVPAIALYDPVEDRWEAPPQPPTGTGPHGPMIWTGSSLFTWFGNGPPRVFHTSPT